MIGAGVAQGFGWPEPAGHRFRMTWSITESADPVPDVKSEGVQSPPRRAPRLTEGGEAWPAVWPGRLDTPIVWRVDLALDDEGRRRCRALLSQCERSRADRFLRAQDRDRYIASHAALRVILAAALGDVPEGLTFETSSFGKPELSGRWSGRLRFNLSHSGAVALVGVAPDASVGVDVEMVRPLADCLGIARGHFSRDEVSAIAASPPNRRLEAFFACWTRKEAFVKALGRGLSLELDAFSVSVPPERACLLSVGGDGRAAQAWRMVHLDPAPGYVGAIAIEARADRCRAMSLPSNWLGRLA